MQIISQDGKMTFKDNKIIIKQIDNRIVFSDCLSHSSYALAQYSTEKEASIAMESYYAACLSYNMFREMTAEQKTALLNSKLSTEEQKNLFGIFQFPQE